MAELSTSINNLQVTSEPQYITVNRELSLYHEVKYLGITLDKGLKVKVNVESVLKKPGTHCGHADKWWVQTKGLVHSCPNSQKL